MQLFFLRVICLTFISTQLAHGEESFSMRDDRQYRQACQGCYSLCIPDENTPGAPLRLEDADGNIVDMDPPQPPAKMSLYACVDINGDGRKEAVIEHFTYGPHCCFDYHFYKAEKKTLVLFENLYLRNACSPVFKDLDRDGKPEILTLDDRFAYFDGLCFACSPQLPLILRYSEGQFTDCTGEFASLLNPRIEQNLEKTASDSTYERGLALEYLALHIIQGREERGWAGVRKHYFNCYSWLKENANRIQSRLDDRVYSKKHLYP
jgi:hypothetical protein